MVLMQRVVRVEEANRVDTQTIHSMPAAKRSRHGTATVWLTRRVEPGALSNNL
jgi:hypothetical protein